MKKIDQIIVKIFIGLLILTAVSSVATMGFIGYAMIQLIKKNPLLG